MNRLALAGLLAALATGCNFGSTPERTRPSAEAKRDLAPSDTVGIDRKRADLDMKEMVDALALFAKDDPREWARAREEIESLPSQAIVPDWVREGVRDVAAGGARGEAARERLGRAGQTGVVLRKLDSENVEDWETARQVCVAMGKEPTYALVQALVRKFSLPFASHWEMARAQLVLVGAPAAPLLGAYIEGSSGAGLKEQCAVTLAYMREAGDEELVRLTGSGDEAVRRAAAMGLGMSGTPRAIQACTRLSRSDPAWGVRAEAVKALGKTRLPETADAVASALGDEDEFVRRQAAEALGTYNCVEAVVALRNAARDPDEQVSAIATRSLDRVLHTLIAMLRAKDPGIRSTAANALRVGTGQKLGGDVRAWENWWKQQR